jgi:hypothetical protein
MFVFGSAVITYNGWPKLGGVGSPATQTLTAHPKPGSHASSHGLASVKVVKPHAGSSASLAATVAHNKRSTLLAQAGARATGGGTTHSATHHSSSGTISNPVAGQRPTHSSTPTKTGSGNGGKGGSGSGNGGGNSGGGSTTTTPTTPVTTTPTTPIAATPTAPVTVGSGSGSTGSGSGSGNGNGNGNGNGHRH